MECRGLGCDREKKGAVRLNPAWGFYFFSDLSYWAFDCPFRDVMELATYFSLFQYATATQGLNTICLTVLLVMELAGVALVENLIMLAFINALLPSTMIFC